MPTLQDYIKKRDWIGAVALLESERNVNIQVENSLWLAYCYFHMGEYRYVCPQLENQSTSMMNSSGRPKIRITISTRHAATMHSASMMTPGGKHSKAQKHHCRLDFSSTLHIRKTMRKTSCTTIKSSTKVHKTNSLLQLFTTCEAIMRKQLKYTKSFCCRAENTKQ